MPITRKLIGSALALLALGLWSAPSWAQAQSQPQAWPSRTVKFILPLGPGSGADISARLIADKLSQKWGQSVVVENKPGGDGFLAITAFTDAKDDHVLLFGPASSFVAHPYMHEKVPYDARELVPIAKITNTVVGVAVPATSKATSLKDVFAEAKAQPGKMNWATITGVTDFIMLGFLKQTGLDMAKVPYRNPVQAQTDLAENRIQLYIAALAIVRAQAQAGRIKLLAVTNTERTPAFPDLPTVEQAGFPLLNFDGLVGLFGPPGMPEDLRTRIAADIKQIVDEPAIKKRLEDTGQLVRPGGPKELADNIAKQRAAVDNFAKVLGVKPAQQGR